MTSARDLLSQAAAVLLDFDGPVTPLMPAPLNWEVADSARRVLTSAGVELPADILETSDHLKVLRYTWTHHREHVNDVELACIAGEVQAADRSTLTRGADDFLAACLATHLPVAIVSNNSADAVEAHLDRLGLRSSVSVITGREPFRPDLMKPNAHSLRVASAALDVPAADTVMVGDSLSDVAAAHSVGAKIVGFGKTPHRAEQLCSAGADLIVYTMSELAAAVPTGRH